MANRTLVFQKLAYDPSTNQYFQVIFVDGGTSYTMYLKDVPEPVFPGLASQISAAGAIPVIAPSGGGDVVGTGSTNKLMRWVDGAASVAGDSVLGEDGSGNLVLPIGNITVTLGNIVCNAGFVSVLDEAYGVAWDGSVQVPTKNAVYDKIESITAAGITGSGTINTLPLFTAGAAIGNSLITQSSGNILIGSGLLALNGSAIVARRYINHDKTGLAPGGVTYGIYNSMQVTDTSTLVGMISNAESLTSGSQNTVEAMEFNGSHNGTGTVSNGVGLVGSFSVNGGGTCTTASGIRASIGTFGAGSNIGVGRCLSGIILNFSPGVIVDAYGLQLSGWVNTGTITRSYGIFLDTSIDVGATRYAILSRSTSQSRLVGNLKLGADSTPAEVLDVTGNIILTGTIIFPDGVRQTFNPDATTPGLNVGSQAGDPSTPTNGDLWYDSTGNLLRARINGASVSLGAQTENVSAQATTPVTVNATTDVGKVFTNEGAAAQIVFNLPGAAAGLTYTFIVQDADGIQVTAAGGDTIRLSAAVSSAAGTATSTTIGSVITLVAINATEWIATSIVGTWVTA